MRRRRFLIAAALVAILTVVMPEVALARGGSGSSAFGGSGGGFGGGSGGGSGKGFALFVAFRLLLDLIVFGHGLGLLIVIALLIGGYFYFYGGAKVADWFRAQRQRGPARRRETKLRKRRVELAAAEAADTDAAFDPERVTASGEKLFLDIQAAWSKNDVFTLRTLVAPRLMAEWERRLDDLQRRGMHNQVEVTRPPKVEFVGIGRGARAAGPAGGPDRVVIRIEARLRDWVVDRNGREINETGAATKTVRMREYWTLQRTTETAGNYSDGHDPSLAAEFDLNVNHAAVAGDWMLASIEQGAEGSHQLEERLIQTEWADDQALQDEALVEQANADAVPAGTNLADLTNTSVAIDSDARARALDLSLADGRFAPDILEVAARRAVNAWAQAIDGETQPLMALADTDTVSQMLYPAGPGSRMVVRGPRVERITITALDALSVPAAMTVDVKLNGRRYLQDRASAAILAGSDIHAVTFTERWTLALSGDAQNPWQITAAASPALTH